VSSRLEKSDRLESENIAFHEKVRAGFLKQAQLEPQRIKIINAFGSIDEIGERIWQEVYPYVQKWRNPDV
jgi:dTMP kinase